MTILRVTAASLMLCTAAVSGGDATGHGTLFWGNGDSLNGDLLSAKGDTLVWNSPLFAVPLSLDLSVLSAVRFPELEAGKPTDGDDGFRVTLVNNNVLYGELLGVDRDSVKFDSRRHGTIVLQRTGIRNLQRTNKQGLVFLGPRGLEGWTHQPERKEVPDWREENDGSLTAVKGEATLSRSLPLPDRCELQVVVASSTMPDFEISIGRDSAASRPRLEMWGDSFVARSAKDFVELLVVPEDQRELKFHAYIDFQKSMMTVYSHTGEKLGELQSENWDKLTKRISIEAIDSDLTLKHLSVNEWDGSIPPKLVPGKSRVHLQNGKLHYGEIIGFSAETQMLKIAATPVEAVTDQDSDASQIPPDMVEIALGDISRVVMSTAEKKTSDVGRTIVAWQNGGFLSGQLVTLDHDFITLKTDFGMAPIRSSLSGVRHIGLPNTDVPNEEPDRLFFDGGSLRGNLTVEDNDEPIRWTPVGGRNAASLVSGGKARFQRGKEPEEIVIDSAQFPDVVYLHDGDVFPCRMEACDQLNLQIVTPVSDVRQMDLKLVKAVEFGNSDRGRQQGFQGDGWKKLLGKIQHYGPAIAFNGNGSFGNASVLSGDAVSFTIRWKANCYGNITFFAYADSLQSPQSATAVNLLLQPSQIIVSDRVPEQNGGMVFWGMNGQGPKDGTVRVRNQEAAVEIVARDGKLQVSVNGKEVKAFDLNTQGAGSRGLLIKAAVTSVNSRNTKSLNTKVRGMVEIDDFLVRNVVGASVKQFVQEEARERALTVPRFRRDDPPTHVLLAPNGDLLRGRLNKVSDTEVVFESRLETFRFPRDRVAAVIWLSQPDASPETPVRAETAVQAKLDNGYMLTMTPERMADGQLIGTSRQLGACRIPAKSIRDLFLGSPEGREEILSYVRWIRHDAAEPEWELPKEGGESAGSAMIGQVVDDFELPTVDGGTFRLSEHADKVIVLDFWATWCGPCVAALPEYVEATADFDAADAVFVAVNLEETPDRIKEFLNRHNLSPTVALDRGSVIAKRFQVSGIPHSVILGRGGVVKHVTVGYQPGVGEKTRERIQQLLEIPLTD